MKLLIFFLKQLPFVRWIKWVIDSSKLHRKYPTLKIGAYTVISNTIFSHRNNIFDNCKIVSSSLGDYTYVGGNCNIQYADIGSFCSIGTNVQIGLGIHPTFLSSTHPAFYSRQSQWKDEIEPTPIDGFEEYKRITIGDDVWIGTNAIILDGVTIGNHSIIAAGAVVTKDIPEYAIVGGVPAKIIKYRDN